MNKQDKLTEATIRALSGKLTEEVDIDNKLNVVTKALDDNHIKYRISGGGEFGYDIYAEYNNNHSYENAQNKDYDWISGMSIGLSPDRENEIHLFEDLTKECTQYLSEDESQLVINTFQDLRDKWIDFDKNLPTVIKILKLIDMSLTAAEEDWTNLPRGESII